MAEDRCVICGAVIPEGRQVCLLCETLVYESDKRSSKRVVKKKNGEKRRKCVILD